jgi:hypothetical protein
MSYYPVMLESTALLVIGMIFALIWTNRFPSLDTVIKALEALNTKGGNLFLLSFFTAMFAIISIRTFLYIIDLSVNGKMNQDNTFALQAIAWVTGGLTTGFMGALLKTMTGDAPVHRESSDIKPDNSGNQNKI